MNVKDLFKISLIIIVVGLIMALTGNASQNYTAMAVGIVFVGLGVTIILGNETDLRKEAYVIIWFALLVLIGVLIGYDGGFPTISIGG